MIPVLDSLYNCCLCANPHVQLVQFVFVPQQANGTGLKTVLIGHIWLIADTPNTVW